MRCDLCQGEAKFKINDKNLCVEHYKIEAFGTELIEEYIKQRNIEHMRSAVDNHIIVKGNSVVLQFARLFGYDWWESVNQAGVYHISLKRWG